MSATETRLPLDEAKRAAHWLMDRWLMAYTTCAIVGSIRREKPDVGDIDLIAPMPERAGADPLHDRIAASLGLVSAGLFAGDDTGAARAQRQLTGEVIQGLNPGFKACRLRIRHRTAGDIKVEIHRYTPANQGWKELMRTGSEEFSTAVLAQWKLVNRIPATRDGSIDGHLVRYSAGSDTPEVVRMPTERHVFLGCQLVYADPRLREDADGLLSPWWLTSDAPGVRERGRKGMVRLGFTNPIAVTEAWNKLRGWCHMGVDG